MEITPVSGEQVQKLVNEIYQTPTAIANKVAEMINH